MLTVYIISIILNIVLSIYMTKLDLDDGDDCTTNDLVYICILVLIPIIIPLLFFKVRGTTVVFKGKK